MSRHAFDGGREILWRYSNVSPPSQYVPGPFLRQNGVSAVDVLVYFKSKPRSKPKNAIFGYRF